MACGCIGNPVVVVNPTCEDCLKIVSLRYACADGPAPCGGSEGTLVEDLALLNDVTACDCGTAMKNLCVGSDCASGEYCDQCDGLCKDSSSDLGLGGGVTTFKSGGTSFV
mgnify:CR=1 FL=1